MDDRIQIRIVATKPDYHFAIGEVLNQPRAVANKLVDEGVAVLVSVGPKETKIVEPQENKIESPGYVARHDPERMEQNIQKDKRARKTR